MYWGIGCGVFVCTVICQLQTNSRQLTGVTSVGKKFEKIPALDRTDCARVSIY